MARAIVIDDNTAVVNGHYNELSSLLLSAAADMGYRPVLVAHRDFQGNGSLPAGCQVQQAFTTRRMTRWSCGFDGQSAFARDENGNPLTRSLKHRYLAFKDEWLTRSQWRPSEMLKRWSEGLVSAISLLKPTTEDELIFQTADDFMMIAMARALAPYRSTQLKIKAIFHYAIHGAKLRSPRSRHAFDQQLNHALGQMSHHEIRLLATTETLADQMNAGSLNQNVIAIPYPIRVPGPRTNTVPPQVPRIVLGGVHRVEQGRDSVAPFLEEVYKRFVATDQFSLTLRLDPKHWERIVPSSLHAMFEPALKRQESMIHGEGGLTAAPLPRLDIQPATLSESRYDQMLNMADIGVLLYDANRYQVRCSGILLEFLTRGVPVIVPDHCWLSTIVKQYGRLSPIGYVFGDSREIPDLLAHFRENRLTMQQATLQAAPIISIAHAPRTTLQAILDRQVVKRMAA